MRTPLIEFQEVSKGFGTNQVLQGINLCIYPGEVTSLVGMSGTGKSVCLKLIIGLLQPDQGDIFYQGQAVRRMSAKQKKAMKAELNYMFQSNALFDSLNVFDNLALPLREKTRIKPRAISAKVRQKMQALDLEDVGHKFPSQLSGGMQKRVALARALITDPQVVLFDEPTTGLDPTRKNNVLSMIVNNQKGFGFTAVLVSHDVPDVFYISNRIALLEEGKIKFQGSAVELEKSPPPGAREFIYSHEYLQNEAMGVQSWSELQKEFDQRQALKPEQAYSVIVFHLQEQAGENRPSAQFALQIFWAGLSQIIRENLSGREFSLCRYSREKILCVAYDFGGQELEDCIQNIRRQLQDRNILVQSGLEGVLHQLRLLIGIEHSSQDTVLQKAVQKAENKQRIFLDYFA